MATKKEYRKITPQKIDEALMERYPNLHKALSDQNWYSYLEALEDLTDLCNTVKGEN